MFAVLIGDTAMYLVGICERQWCQHLARPSMYVY